MWDQIFIYSLKVSLIFGVVYGFYLLLLRKDTHFKAKRIALLAILVLSLCAPVVKIKTTSPVQDSPYRFESLNALSETTAPTSTIPLSQPTTAVDSESHFDWWNLMVKTYIIGALLAALYLIIQIVGLGYLLINGHKDAPDKSIVKHRLVRHPFSFGRWIFLPENEVYDEDTLQTIIKHEQAHLSQLHSIDVLAVSIFRIILWYNPLSYGLKKSIKYNHECLADQAVLDDISPEVYARQILGVAFGTEHFSLGHSFSLRSNILNRIKVMNMKKTQPFKTTISLFFLASAFTLFFSQMSLVAQEEDDFAKSRTQIKRFEKAMAMVNAIKVRPTSITFVNDKFIPIQGLPKHLKALEKLQKDYPNKNVRISYFDEKKAKYMSGPGKNQSILNRAGSGEVLFSDKLSEKERDELYNESVKWATENVLPLFPDYPRIDKSIFDKYEYVAIRTIPSYDEAAKQYDDVFKFGTKMFKMNQVDKLPEPKGGLENFLRNVALHAETDASLSLDDLPRKIEFQFEIGLDGQMSLLKLLSNVKGPEEVQDKVYKLLRQIHDNLKPNAFFKWAPGMKEGSPVVTQMKVEIPKKYLK